MEINYPEMVSGNPQGEINHPEMKINLPEMISGSPQRKNNYPEMISGNPEGKINHHLLKNKHFLLAKEDILGWWLHRELRVCRA